MPGTPSRPKLLPWIAAALGLVLGLLAPTLRDPSARSSPTPSTSPRAQPFSRSNLLPAGSTAAFLRSSFSLSASECEAQVRALLAANEPNRETKLEAVFRRWLALANAGEILAIVDADPVLSRYRLITRTFFHAWVAIDETAAMAPGDRPEFSTDRALFAIEHDYSDFIDYLSNPRHSDSSQSGALTALARRNPELARTIAGTTLSADAKRDALAAVARGLASHDPQSALSWLDSLDLDPALSTRSLIAIFSEWARTDPAAAHEARAAYSDMPGANLFPSPDHPPSFLTTPTSATSQLQLALFNNPFLDVASLHQHLMHADIDWDGHSFPFPAINHDGWYSPDPEHDALAAAKLPPGHARDLIIEAICNNWVAHDPDAACHFAESNGISSSYLDRLREAPTEEDRAAASAAPQQTFAALFDREEGIDYSKLSQLAAEWAAAAPVAASEWLITQEFAEGSLDPSERSNSSLFSNALGYHWARQDPIGAARWVESLPEGPVQSRAWAAIHHSVTSYAPDLAFSLSAAWLDGPSRLGHLEASVKAVGTSIGYPAALSLLNSADLSPAEASALAESLRAAMTEPAQ